MEHLTGRTVSIYTDTDNDTFGVGGQQIIGTIQDVINVLLQLFF